MNPYQKDVREFHIALDIPVGVEGLPPKVNRPELRAELIREESKELRKAILDGDIIAAIDGMCDVIVVTLGSAVEFGLDLDPFWREVHRTNMAKKGGAVRADGKRLKPPGWTPPDIEKVLREVYGNDWHSR